MSPLVYAFVAAPVLALPCLIVAPLLAVSTRWYLKRAPAGYHAERDAYSVMITGASADPSAVSGSDWASCAIPPCAEARPIGYGEATLASAASPARRKDGGKGAAACDQGTAPFKGTSVAGFWRPTPSGEGDR